MNKRLTLADVLRAPKPRVNRFKVDICERCDKEEVPSYRVVFKGKFQSDMFVCTECGEFLEKNRSNPALTEIHKIIQLVEEV